MSLLKELSTTKVDLKNSDATDAGANDVADKALSGKDISFSLMRNTINSDGEVTGSNVSDYLERAGELNDEVDTVPFGLETDDGSIVKVYVNAEQADKFEEALKQLLGIEDDIEEAINRLATEYDIIDVVWPKVEGEEGEDDDPDADLTIDDAGLGDDLDDEDDDMEIIASLDDDDDDEDETTKADDETADDPEDEELDADGNPIKKKKKVDAAVKESQKDEEADRPSQAAVLKLMTQKGLHPTATVEDPDGTVYIEDSEGDEYVVRADKKLTKEKHGKKLTALKKESQLEKNMTIGSKFLDRVLAEAKEDRDGVKDGFNVPLDAQARILASKLKRPYEKKLVALFAMAGVPGRYMNTSEIEESISGASDMLRKQISVRRAFDAFYTSLATAKGHSIPEEPVEEGKINEARGKKRGSFIQKLFETVLVKFGLPESLVSTTGPAAVGQGLYKAAELIEQDSTLERNLRQLAIRLGIKATDAMQEGKKEDGPVEVTGVRGLKSTPFRKKFKSQAELEKWMDENGDDISDVKFVNEAVDVGQDDYANAVVKLCADLGIPDDILQRRRQQLVTALRQKKMTLKNRTQIMTLMGRVSDAVAKGSTQGGENSDEANS